MKSSFQTLVPQENQSVLNMGGEFLNSYYVLSSMLITGYTAKSRERMLPLLNYLYLGDTRQ